MKTKGLKRVQEIFWYSDSEPNEVLIALCHLICLPLALITELHSPSVLLILGAIMAGAFQLWSVLWNGTLQMRLYAVQAASLIAIATCINLRMAHLMTGSRTGWCIIAVFAMWNTVRVFKEKIERGL